MEPLFISRYLVKDSFGYRALIEVDRETYEAIDKHVQDPVWLEAWEKAKRGCRQAEFISLEKEHRFPLQRTFEDSIILQASLITT